MLWINNIAYLFSLLYLYELPSATGEQVPLFCVNNSHTHRDQNSAPEVHVTVGVHAPEQNRNPSGCYEIRWQNN